MEEKLTKEELNMLKSILFIKKGNVVVWESQEYKEYREDLERLENSRYPREKHMSVLRAVVDTSKGSLYEMAIKCFAYGVMIGKRYERAKKKKAHN